MSRKVKIRMVQTKIAEFEIDCEEYGIDDNFKSMYDFINELTDRPSEVWGQETGDGDVVESIELETTDWEVIEQ